MWDKLKNLGNKLKSLSLGKKVYASFWAVWVILIAILIGLFTGLKDTMNDSIPPKDGWTLKQNKDNWQYLVKRNNKLTGVDTPATYYVKDIRATNTKENLAKMKAAIKKAVGADWQATWDKLDVYDVISQIRKLDVKTKQEVINQANRAEWENTKFVIIEEAKKTQEFNTLYDSSVAYTNAAGTRTYLIPHYDSTSKKFVDTSVLTPDAWKTTPTSKAKDAKTVTAVFGLLFLIDMMAAVGTTVYVSIKEKKGGKK